jgi:hypothetical protein
MTGSALFAVSCQPEKWLYLACSSHRIRTSKISRQAIFTSLKNKMPVIRDLRITDPMLKLCAAAALPARPTYSPWLYSARDFIEKQIYLYRLQDFFSHSACTLSESCQPDRRDT